MWIRSQNRKHLINPNNIVVERNLGGKKKFALMSNTIGLSTVIIGLFDTKEDAILELDHIQAAIESNPSGTYQIR